MSSLSSYRVAIEAGEPHSIIRVSNLQASAKVGTDAWGRSGILQPILLSAAVSLRNPFSAASSTDSVNESTIHYGILSKAILAAVGAFEVGTLPHLWSSVVQSLTAGEGNGPDDGITAVVDTKLARSLELEVRLPKGSLIGEGVSYSGTRVFDKGGHVVAQNKCLKLHTLRIPTLIGVNPVERLAKQIVIANVELDGWWAWNDTYARLEDIVVKTIEESTFETLEALAFHTVDRIQDLFYRTFPILTEPTTQIKVSLRKPTAVTFADAPAVEFMTLAKPSPSSSPLIAPPFPLQGRLDDWLRENMPNVE